MLSINDGVWVIVVKVEVKASTKDAEDEAQKSTALRLERPKKSL